jgi:NADH dehydrogenase FAD-containing subunit
VDSVTDEGVVVNTPEGTVTVPADTVIMSVGYNPDKRFDPENAKDSKARKDNRVRAFVNAYSDSNGPEVFFVGDCDKVGSLRTVIRQAYELVQKISY